MKLAFEFYDNLSERVYNEREKTIIKANTEEYLNLFSPNRSFTSHYGACYFDFSARKKELLTDSMRKMCMCFRINSAGFLFHTPLFLFPGLPPEGKTTSCFCTDMCSSVKQQIFLIKRI